MKPMKDIIIFILNGKIQREDMSTEAYRTQPSDLSHRLVASVPGWLIVCLEIGSS